MLVSVLFLFALLMRSTADLSRVTAKIILFWQQIALVLRVLLTDCQEDTAVNIEIRQLVKLDTDTETTPFVTISTYNNVKSLLPY